MASESTTTVLDAGALIAVERQRASMQVLIADAAGGAHTLVVPAPVLAQAWRGGSRQALLARFLNLPFVEVDLLSRGLWQAVGTLCGTSTTSDVVDAAVVVCARQRKADAVVTSDPDDLRRLDPGLDYFVP